MRQHDGERTDRAMMIAPEPGGDRHHLVRAHHDGAAPAVVQLAIAESATAFDDIEVFLGIGVGDITLGRHDAKLLLGVNRPIDWHLQTTTIT